MQHIDDTDSFSPVPAVSFPTSTCYHCDGCAVSRSNDELGKASPLLPKLICHAMCLVRPWEDSAFCLAATLAAGNLQAGQAGHRSHSPLQPLPPAFRNISLNSLTSFPLCWKVAAFFRLVFLLKLIKHFLFISGGSNTKVQNILKFCAGNREPWCKVELPALT